MSAKGATVKAAEEVDRWQPQSQARQVELSLELSDDLPDLDLDRMRMSQALGNVINNAIHCTQAGGSIVIRAGDDMPDGYYLQSNGSRVSNRHRSHRPTARV